MSLFGKDAACSLLAGNINLLARKLETGTDGYIVQNWNIFPSKKYLKGKEYTSKRNIILFSPTTTFFSDVSSFVCAVLLELLYGKGEWDEGRNGIICFNVYCSNTHSYVPVQINQKDEDGFCWLLQHMLMTTGAFEQDLKEGDLVQLFQWVAHLRQFSPLRVFKSCPS